MARIADQFGITTHQVKAKLKAELGETEYDALTRWIRGSCNGKDEKPQTAAQQKREALDEDEVVRRYVDDWETSHAIARSYHIDVNYIQDVLRRRLGKEKLEALARQHRIENMRKAFAAKRLDNFITAEKPKGWAMWPAFPSPGKFRLGGCYEA